MFGSQSKLLMIVAMMWGGVLQSIYAMTAEDAAFERTCPTPKSHLVKQLSQMQQRMQELENQLQGAHQNGNQDGEALKKQLEEFQEEKNILETALERRKESRENLEEDVRKLAILHGVTPKGGIRDILEQFKSLSSVDINQNIPSQKAAEEELLKRVNEKLQTYQREPVSDLVTGATQLLEELEEADEWVKIKLEEERKTSQEAIFLDYPELPVQRRGDGERRMSEGQVKKKRKVSDGGEFDWLL